MKQPQYIQQPFQPRLPSSLEELLRDNKTLLCFTEHPTSMDIDWDNFDETMEDWYQDEKEEHTDKNGNVEDFIPSVGLPKSKLLEQAPSFQEVFDLAKEVIPNATLNDIFVDLQELEISGYIYYTYTTSILVRLHVSMVAVFFLMLLNLRTQGLTCLTPVHVRLL